MSAYRYEPGTQPIDGYTIQYALGRGGFGEVYFAISDAGREVALKAVQNYEETELRGIRHCMNLKSSHLVMIFDVKVAQDGTPWVIMEYVAGPSLKELLEESPNGIGPQKAAFFLRELCVGLADLHEAGIVHRDLKPHNVFFENRTVKIGDYSLSKAMTASHRSGHTMTIGSVHYMAPEISMGRYDKTVDIYALGVILYEMLTGTPPFTGESVGEILMKHLQSDPDLSLIDPEFAPVIAKAMQRDPKQRYQSTEEMAAALFGSSDLGKLADTLNPQSLSLVSERPRERKRIESQNQQSILETVTSPLGLVDTKDALGSSVDAPPLDWIERLASVDGHFVEGQWHHRLSFIVIAICCTWWFLAIGIMSGEVRVSYALAFAISIYLTLAVMISRWFFRCVPFCRSDSKYAHRMFTPIVRRIVSLIPLGLVTIVLMNAFSHDEFRTYEISIVGFLISLSLVDWIKLISPRRKHLVSWLPTVVIGAIAAIVSLIGWGNPNQLVFDAALVMSAAFALQLISPVSTMPQSPMTRPSETQQESNSVELSPRDALDGIAEREVDNLSV